MRGVVGKDLTVPEHAVAGAEPAGGRDGGPIPVGVRVRVASVDGLTLLVEPLGGEVDVFDE